MASPKIPVTFTFHKDGTQPPVFVAGSFSDPSWQPQEMDAAMKENGEYSFTKHVEVGDASEIQYKFRIGLGDWWTIDSTADTVTDAQGNVNNVLKPSPIKPIPEIIPAEVSRVRALKESAPPSGVQTLDFGTTAADVADSAKLLDPTTPEPTITDEEAGRVGVRRLSATPIDEVARTAAEVAEDAAKLDSDDAEVVVSDDTNEESPMFSHECLGASRINIETPITKEPGILEPLDETTDLPTQYPDESEIDFDDPQLEHFPSENRDSIMAAMRRLSTTIEVDRTVVDVIPPSTVISTSQKQAQSAAPMTSGAPSAEDQTEHLEDDQDSSDLVQPAEPTEAAASLQSIAEDDEALNEAAGRNGTPTQPIQHSGPASKTEALPEPIGSDDDEGIAMYNRSYQNSVKDQRDDSSCQASDCQASDTHDSRADDSETEQSALDDSLLEPEDKVVAAHEDISPKTIPADDVRAANTSTAAPIEPVVEEDVIISAGSADTSEARSTSLDACSDTNLRKQTNDDRPDSPLSTRSLDNVQKDGKWLKAFLHTILVDWIGGLLLLLCGGRKNRA
ncbi:hypothetical protein F5X96DRAFT_106474 [Biscogniauxia mediterranea]|nr:hypothetical protein F5X96DRAFT_106474 [Biscogniauxia mediterranea]